MPWHWQRRRAKRNPAAIVTPAGQQDGLGRQSRSDSGAGHKIWPMSSSHFESPCIGVKLTYLLFTRPEDSVCKSLLFIETLDPVCCCCCYFFGRVNLSERLLRHKAESTSQSSTAMFVKGVFFLCVRQCHLILCVFSTFKKNTNNCVFVIIYIYIYIVSN